MECYKVREVVKEGSSASIWSVSIRAAEVRHWRVGQQPVTLLAGVNPLWGGTLWESMNLLKVLLEEEDVGTQAPPSVASSILVTQSWAALLPLWSPRHKVMGTSEHGQKALEEWSQIEKKRVRSRVVYLRCFLFGTAKEIWLKESLDTL